MRAYNSVSVVIYVFFVEMNNLKTTSPNEPKCVYVFVFLDQYRIQRVKLLSMAAWWR